MEFRFTLNMPCVHTKLPILQAFISGFTSLDYAFYLEGLKQYSRKSVKLGPSREALNAEVFDALKNQTYAKYVKGETHVKDEVAGAEGAQEHARVRRILHLFCVYIHCPYFKQLQSIDLQRTVIKKSRNKS